MIALQGTTPDLVRDVSRKFALLEGRYARKLNRQAALAGAKVLTAAAKPLVPVATGATKKALGQVVRAYKKGRLMYGVFGVRWGQKREVTRTFSKRGKQRIKLKKTAEKNVYGQREVRDPARTVHLADSGRSGFSVDKPLPLRLPGGALVFRRKVQAARGSGFLARTRQQSLMPAIHATLAHLKAGTDVALREAARTS